MTSFERASQDRSDRQPPPELVFWACLAIVTAMGLIGLILGVVIHEFRAESADIEAWGEIVIAMLFLSAPVLAPAAVMYGSVFCRNRLAALVMSAALGVASIGAFFGMLAATFYSEAATAVLLLMFGVLLRVGHLNSCWYSVLEREKVAPQAKFRLLDLGFTLFSLAIASGVATWTWARTW